MDIDLAKLGRFIANHFDLDQLQTLCQELGVSYDQLVGDTRSARAFDLVTVMRDRGQLSALLAAVARARSDIFNPRDFRAERERGRHLGTGWLALLGGVVLLALLAAFVFLSNQRAAPAPSPSPQPPTKVSMATAVSPTRSLVATLSPSPIVLTPTPSPIPATPTVESTSVGRTATPTVESTSVGHTATPTRTFTPTPTPTPPPTSTPVLSPRFPVLSYDTETRTLRLAPGDTSLRRARLCTPLNAYQSPQIVYLVGNVADALGVALPAQARVTHSFPERLTGDLVVRTLEIRRHPLKGIKVTGEEADFTGCDLLVSADLRQVLGFPVSLGEFDDPPRFDHGWVTIEFLAAP